MAQRSRLSPQTEPDEIRAARVEDAPSHLATARPGRAVHSSGASSSWRRYWSPLSGSRAHPNLASWCVRGFAYDGSSPITFGSMKWN